MADGSKKPLVAHDTSYGPFIYCTGKKRLQLVAEVRTTDDRAFLYEELMWAMMQYWPEAFTAIEWETIKRP